MPLVAPNIVRYTIVGTLAGQDCQSILDVRITDDILTSREEEIVRVAGDLLNQWDDEILPLVSTTYTAEAIRWVDLDSASGGTGARTSTDGATWPKAGSGAGAPLPNNTYAKMVKNLEGKTRQQRAGALRLGGLLESWTDPGAQNTIQANVRDILNTAFENLKDGINEGGLTGTVNCVVVHTVNGVATGYSEISSFNCAPVVGTLRRRMPGYGS